MGFKYCSNKSSLHDDHLSDPLEQYWAAAVLKHKIVYLYFGAQW